MRETKTEVSGVGWVGKKTLFHVSCNEAHEDVLREFLLVITHTLLAHNLSCDPNATSFI